MNKTYEWRWQFSHYSNIKMKYQYCSKITFIIFWADIARFLQHFINLSNSFINIFAILHDFNEIFLKYSLNITVLFGCWISIWSIFLYKFITLFRPRTLRDRFGHYTCNYNNLNVITVSLQYEDLNLFFTS